MPLHDWTRVSAGTYHHFHVAWINELAKTLNTGLLPTDYYAMSEQVAGEIGPDVLTLQTTGPGAESPGTRPEGATAVAEAPPKVRTTQMVEETDLYAMRRRTLTIRHTSGDRIVALMEILSPGNKNRRRALEQFINKAVSALARGYHLLLVDPLPPGPYDPQGIHGALWAEYHSPGYEAPAGRPLTLAAYSAGFLPTAYVEPVAVGVVLPDMPLFLDEDWYISVPLEETYCEAYASVPGRWQEVIEER